MHFYLQSDSGGQEKEILDLKYVLQNFGNQFVHEYDDITTEDIKTASFGSGVSVPVGDLGFVGAFLKNVKCSDYMKPIEVPEFLRKPEYLHRYYGIGKFKDLPKSGMYFIKDATYLKNWQADIFTMSDLKDTIPKLQEDWEEHEYVCSGVLDTIYSEWRVLVHEDKVVGIQYYSGFQSYDTDTGYSSHQSGVLDFPDSDMITSLTEDIKRYRLLGGIFPKSYTLDVAVTPRGTALLEVHNFVSCGTYGYFDSNLIWMYRDGIDYELNQ